jgi:hypothetical protein
VRLIAPTTEQLQLEAAVANYHSAHIGDGLSQQQVTSLIGEAIEQIETAWGDLGFDDPSEHSDLGTRIMGHVDQLTRDRLTREYPLYKGQ